jgi:hypothetical protein
VHKFLIGFLAFSWPLPAVAANWVKVVQNDDKTAYLDTSSIATEEGYKTAWTKWIYSSGDYTEARYLVLYNCESRKTAVRSGVMYKRDGTSISANANDYELKWEYVVPDTLGEDVFNAVCN